MEGDEGAESTTPPTDDDVLREQSFKRPQGLNLDSFMVATPSSDDATSDGASSLDVAAENQDTCLLYTSPSPRDYAASRMPSSA